MSREYVLIISSDECEFIFSRRVAELCPKFQQHIKIAEAERSDFNQLISFNIGIKSEYLEIVIQYLHYKSRWQSFKVEQLPKFEIPGDKALEVLKAATELKL